MTENVSIIDTLALGKARVVSAYLIRGKETALVDMGYRSSIETLLQDLEDVTVDYLLPTHVHLDHCGACGTLAKEFPHANIQVHPIGQKHLADPSLLIEGTRELFGQELVHQYGLPEPIDLKRVHAAEDDGQIDLGDGITLRTVWTPGHASHHLSYLIESSATVLTGDCVGVYFPHVPVLTPTTPPTSFNLDKAFLSLDRVRKLNPKLFCTPHFGVVNNPESWIDANVDVLTIWEGSMKRALASGLSIDKISQQMVGQVASKLQRAPADLPAHFTILVRVNVMGFVRWLQYKSEKGH